jgi:hypothetical protein
MNSTLSFVTSLQEETATDSCFISPIGCDWKYVIRVVYGFCSIPEFVRSCVWSCHTIGPSRILKKVFSPYKHNAKEWISCDICVDIVPLLTMSLKFRAHLVFQSSWNVWPCPFAVPAFTVLVLVLVHELLVAIHPAMRKASLYSCPVIFSPPLCSSSRCRDLSETYPHCYSLRRTESLFMAS